MADKETVEWCQKVFEALTVLRAEVEVQSTRIKILEKEAGKHDHPNHHQDGEQLH